MTRSLRDSPWRGSGGRERHAARGRPARGPGRSGVRRRNGSLGGCLTRPGHGRFPGHAAVEKRPAPMMTGPVHGGPPCRDVRHPRIDQFQLVKELPDLRQRAGVTPPEAVWAYTAFSRSVLAAFARCSGVACDMTRWLPGEAAAMRRWTNALGIIGIGDEMQDGNEQDGDRLGEVQGPGRLGDQGPGIAQVAVRVGASALRAADQQRAGMAQDNRIMIGIHDPAGRASDCAISCTLPAAGRPAPISRNWRMPRRPRGTGPRAAGNHGSAARRPRRRARFRESYRQPPGQRRNCLFRRAGHYTSVPHWEPMHQRAAPFAGILIPVGPGPVICPAHVTGFCWLSFRLVPQAFQQAGIAPQRQAALDGLDAAGPAAGGDAAEPVPLGRPAAAGRWPECAGPAAEPRLVCPCRPVAGQLAAVSLPELAPVAHGVHGLFPARPRRLPADEPELAHGQGSQGQSGRGSHAGRVQCARVRPRRAARTPYERIIVSPGSSRRPCRRPAGRSTTIPCSARRRAPGPGCFPPSHQRGTERADCRRHRELR